MSVSLGKILSLHCFVDLSDICDAIKQNDSEVEKYQILFFGICYLHII